MGRQRGGRTALVVGAVALLAVSCSSSSSQGGSPTAAPDTSSPAAPSTVTVSATPTTATVTASGTEQLPSAASSTAAGIALCSTGNAAVTAEDLTPGGSHYLVEIHLRNTGRSACHTQGYPGVAVVASSGRQVFQAQRVARGYAGGLPPAQDRPAYLVLRPGQEASALLEGASLGKNGESCPKYTALLVTPPDTRESTRVRGDSFACQAPQIHPFLRGSNGTGS